MDQLSMSTCIMEGHFGVCICHASIFHKVISGMQKSMGAFKFFEIHVSMLYIVTRRCIMKYNQ